LAITSSQRTVTLMALPPTLFRRWVHSSAEDAGGVEVYRPYGYPFLPSRAYDGFEPFENGTFVQHTTDATGGTIAVKGRWTSLGLRRFALVPHGATSEEAVLTIVGVDEAALRVRRRLR